MYQKPKVERFGTLRELTKGGWGWGSKPDAGSDLTWAFGCESGKGGTSHS